MLEEKSIKIFIIKWERQSQNIQIFIGQKGVIYCIQKQEKIQNTSTVMTLPLNDETLTRTNQNLFWQGGWTR